MNDFILKIWMKALIQKHPWTVTLVAPNEPSLQYLWTYVAPPWKGWPNDLISQQNRM